MVVVDESMPEKAKETPKPNSRKVLNIAKTGAKTIGKTLYKNTVGTLKSVKDIRDPEAKKKLV